MRRIAIVTNVLPSYRQAFYERLVERFGTALTIYCQASISGTNIETVHDRFAQNVRLVRACGLKYERAVWQFLPFRELRDNYDCYFFYGNPRVVSTVVVATLLRILGRKVVIWGQYHTAGASPFLESLRLAWWRLFRHIFLYTDRDVAQLRSHHGFQRHVLIGMNNGLDQVAIDAALSKWTNDRLAAWRRQHDMDGSLVLISSGRLDESKKFALVVEALPGIVKRYPQVIWCVVGDGSERARLEQLVRQAGIERHIRWLGAVYDEDQLAPVFLSATLLLQPGTIGLTLLHAYGYGVPVVTHNNNDKHMPEIAAFVEENEALRFAEDDVKDFEAKVIAALDRPELLKKISDTARRVARENFNTDVMFSRFCQMVAEVGSAPDIDGSSVVGE